MPYRFERDELLKLLIIAYKEGNCGFLDLAESVADKLIEENENKCEEKPEAWPAPYPDGLQNSSIVVANYGGSLSTSLSTGTIPNASGSLPVFTLSSSTNNFSNEQVAIDSININANNLVITNSNEVAQWEPYSEANLIRKEV